MAATTLGTTGNWGIPNEQPGLILYDVSYEYSQQEKTVLTTSGEVQGLAFYQQKVEVKASGLVPKTSPFSGKLGTVLVLTNAIHGHLTTTGGSSIITQINRSFNNEDFEKIEIAATHYPLLSIAA